MKDKQKYRVICSELGPGYICAQVYIGEQKKFPGWEWKLLEFFDTVEEAEAYVRQQEA